MGETVFMQPESEPTTNRLKTNLKVWVVYSSEAFHLHMKSELAKCRNLHLDFCSLNNVSETFLHNLAAPDLIFVEAGDGWAQKMQEMQQYNFSWGEHESSLIVFGDEGDSEMLRTALRIGASDFLSREITISGMMPMLEKTATQKLDSLSFGELFLFINSKGGMGATTLALNSAIELASYHQNKVLLLDIDLQFGVIPDYLNVQPAYSISDAIAISKDLDEVSLGSLVHKHESGLHILSFKHENLADDFEQAKRIGRLLPILRRFYPYTIIDLSRGVDHVFASTIAPATRVFLVAQQNLVSVRNSARLLNSLAFEYGLQKEIIEVIVNRYEKRQSIKIGDIEHALKGQQLHLVPNDFKVAIDSANLGKPFVSTKKRSFITRSIIDFSHKIVPPEKVEKGWFSKLFS
ncbi:AAA family ATPase [Vibrio harveyi]|jgi:pilus assembly protein CpaE|uniref:AAA family ATPase n=1 Tax=Vibrio harveyi TaxID=669 RepID=UPI000682DEE8|nr:AAA family ATPase [Vibrio harveyi]EKO3798210.1 AAA family ATPase [Vibrio harveyi]EKO3805194.1 AAA family ATPase [Vibrio harveyi]EKO3850677.1 AAA family ATPase [Vibrio harveyi]ELH4833196.1 AAA family ATPase [Vibrio harveyi]WCP81721.1 AAA family ATPase [Vibrio harveyi]